MGPHIKCSPWAIYNGKIATFYKIKKKRNLIMKKSNFMIAIETKNDVWEDVRLEKVEICRSNIVKISPPYEPSLSKRKQIVTIQNSKV